MCVRSNIRKALADLVRPIDLGKLRAVGDTRTVVYLKAHGQDAFAQQHVRGVNAHASENVLGRTPHAIIDVSCDYCGACYGLLEWPWPG